MISVIMPLYNADKFLEETLISISKQSWTNYELICIDDGSDDLTVSIVEKFMKEDSRIKLLHNEQRKGAAYSRNIALKYAKGEYVTFLDGDDVFEEEMFEKAYSLAKEHELDVVIYEFLHVDSNRIHEKRIISRDYNYKRKYCSKPFSVLDVEPEDYISWSNSPCNKLFKKEFIVTNKLEFQMLSSSNDVYFVEMAFLLAERIMFLDDRRVMVYAREHSTSTRISSDRDPMCTYYACKKIIEEILLRGCLETRGKYIYLKSYFIILNGIFKAKTEEKKVKFYDFLQKEGIERLKLIDQKNYDSLPQYVKNFFEKFNQNNYITRWFEEESLINLLIQRRGHKILEFFESDKRVVIWGAGCYGKNLVKYIETKDVKIQSIVDSDQKKHGSKVGEYEIKCVKAVDFNHIDIVIVAAKGVYSEVEEQLRHYNIHVIDLLTYLEYGNRAV